MWARVRMICLGLSMGLVLAISPGCVSQDQKVRGSSMTLQSQPTFAGLQSHPGLPSHPARVCIVGPAAVLREVAREAIGDNLGVGYDTNGDGLSDYVETYKRFHAYPWLYEVSDSFDDEVDRTFLSVTQDGSCEALREVPGGYKGHRT